MTQSGDLSPVDDDDRHRPHRPADDKEELYFQGSPLLRGAIGRLLLCWLIGLVFVVAPLAWWWTRSAPVWWVFLVSLLIGLILFFWPVVLTRTIRYRISNYRIDFERGILSRSVDTLELWHVEDISLHQSLLDRILRVGTITVISGDETTPKLLLRGIPRPRPVFDSLKQRIIAVKRQRGVIKMDLG